MIHPKLPPRERVGMWSTIRAAIIAGWPETVRLIVVLVVISALVYAVVALTHQAPPPVGILHLLISHLPTPRPR